VEPRLFVSPPSLVPTTSRNTPPCCSNACGSSTESSRNTLYLPQQLLLDGVLLLPSKQRRISSRSSAGSERWIACPESLPGAYSLSSCPLHAQRSPYPVYSALHPLPRLPPLIAGSTTCSVPTLTSTSHRSTLSTSKASSPAGERSRPLPCVLSVPQLPLLNLSTPPPNSPFSSSNNRSSNRHDHSPSRTTAHPPSKIVLESRARRRRNSSSGRRRRRGRRLRRSTLSS
jgi:hypothetical protein